ncbi:MAG: SH3 domain-containing protein [Lachnospiraceae bacterium]|nr:SH3 domain-containing protein [Lachnospiraceae bacterium]
MKQFKEWLSDYLRYFLLLLAAILAFFLILAGVRIYQNSKKPDAANAIQIITETETETTEKKQTETKMTSETESETEMTSETESESEAESETEQETETAADTAGTKEETAVQAQSSAQTDAAAAQTETAAAATEKPTEPQSPAEKATETQPATETEYTPIYKTLKGSCYIRSGPSMDAEIIGEYMYGTTVEFLEDVGGWYKVRIDGMVGYMGARFF